MCTQNCSDTENVAFCVILLRYNMTSFQSLVSVTGQVNSESVSLYGACCMTPTARMETVLGFCSSLTLYHGYIQGQSERRVILN